MEKIFAKRKTDQSPVFSTYKGFWQQLRNKYLRKIGKSFEQTPSKRKYYDSPVRTCKCLITGVIRGLQFKTTIRYYHSTWTMNFQMFKLDLEKAEEPEVKLPTSAGSLKKQESSRKTSALLSMPKPLTVWITTNCGKFSKRWEYQTTWPASWEICMQVKKQQLELDMEQQTGSK